MTVDQALEYVESGRPGRRQRHAAWELAKEVRRLRAAVEAVRALPEYYFSDIYPLVYRDDALRILEGE